MAEGEASPPADEPASAEEDVTTPEQSSEPAGEADSGSPQGDADSDSPQGDADSGSPPARRFTSAGNRLQATLAAADTAAEDILESARAEARELIQRAEQVATDRTAQLQTQVEILLTRANDLTQRAQALSEATRELTSSVNRVVSVEAPAVTELELSGGDMEPLIAAPIPPRSLDSGTPAEAVEEAQVESEPAPAEAEEEQPQAEQEPAAPEEEAAAAEAPQATATPTPAAAPAAKSGPPVSQPPPPPRPEQAQEADAEAAEAAEEAEGAPKRRRGLFSRLRRGGHAEEAAEVQRSERRPRASAEAIADVSPGHQMLARQMLLDGLSEDEVERRLRDEFRVQDPGAVLDSLQLSGPQIPPGKDEANE